MPALIFGLGYLGAALAERLVAEGTAVVGVDNGFSTDLATLRALAARSRGRLRLVEADIRDADQVAAAYAAAGDAGTVGTVYLLAAQASALPAAAPAEYTEETNLRGPRHVLDGAVRHGVASIVYGSSFHVYGAVARGRIDEATPYGAFRDLSHLSKVYAEKLGELYAGQHGVGFAPVRLGIVYGIGPVVKRDLRFTTVPHAFCIRALAGDALVVNPSGLAPQPFVALEDAVDALLAAPAPGYAPANAVGEVLTVVEVAQLVGAAAVRRGLSPVIRLPGDLGPGAADRYACTTRLERAGWRPRRRLEGAVDTIMEHYAAQAEPVA